jgi:[protein-PII] uridylyltransferase
MLEQLAQAMREQLLAPQPGRDFLKSVMPRTLKHFPIATRVNFSLAHNGTQTIMEVMAQDRPGLLHQVALALQHCQARLVTAKIATYGERAEDVFFITGRDGLVLSEASQDCLQTEIVRRLGSASGKPAESVILL